MMRKTIQVLALALALAASARAGDIQCPAPTPPPSNAAQEPQGSEVQNGEIECGLTQSALSLLASVLPIL